MKRISENELARVEGGAVLPWFFGAMLGSFIYDVLSDPDSIIEGFGEGVNRGLNRGRR